MKIIAPAKLNLYLHITGRRDDGYHLLDSLFAFTAFGDEITITPSSSLTLTIDGPFSSVFDQDAVENNLIFRAALLLKNKYAVNAGAHILLTKNIPVAAGLGGGSSDAAAVLKGLNQLWKLRLSIETLSEIGLTLGADIPACLYQKTALISGIGEQIMPLALPFSSHAVLLINPLQPLSTQSVFQHYHPAFRSSANQTGLIQATDWQSFLSVLLTYQNDLETAATTLLPAIHDIIHHLQQQKHCELARMSGSGPTCFALFSDLQSAEHAAQTMRVIYPAYWLAVTSICW